MRAGAKWMGLLLVLCGCTEDVISPAADSVDTAVRLQLSHNVAETGNILFFCTTSRIRPDGLYDYHVYRVPFTRREFSEAGGIIGQWTFNAPGPEGRTSWAAHCRIPRSRLGVERSLKQLELHDFVVSVRGPISRWINLRPQWVGSSALASAYSDPDECPEEWGGTWKIITEEDGSESWQCVITLDPVGNDPLPPPPPPPPPPSEDPDPGEPPPSGGSGTPPPPGDPVDGPVDDDVLVCGDERDDIIAEYVDYSVTLRPSCESFTQSERSDYFSHAELTSTNPHS